MTVVAAVAVGIEIVAAVVGIMHLLDQFDCIEQTEARSELDIDFDSDSKKRQMNFEYYLMMVLIGCIFLADISNPNNILIKNNFFFYFH